MRVRCKHFESIESRYEGKGGKGKGGWKGRYKADEGTVGSSLVVRVEGAVRDMESVRREREGGEKEGKEGRTSTRTCFHCE
jgi:hypothetical protein